jgi:chorismate synthase
VIDGCPPGIALAAEDLQAFLDKRRPGQSRFTTQRREPDAVRILSGVFADEAGRQVTTGTPISLLIDNVDQRGRDYADIKDKFRPGHADFTYLRNTASRLPRRRALLGARDGHARGRRRGRPQGHSRRHHPRRAGRIGKHAIDRARWSWGEVDSNPFFSPDAGIVDTWSDISTRCARRAPRSAR